MRETVNRLKGYCSRRRTICRFKDEIEMQNVLERMEAIGAERKMADFNVKMKMDYEFKKNYAYIRAWEFYNECCARGLNCHVSVGGLDSITLFLFLRSIGINVPAISVSHLEDQEHTGGT